MQRSQSIDALALLDGQDSRPYDTPAPRISKARSPACSYRRSRRIFYSHLCTHPVEDALLHSGVSREQCLADHRKFPVWAALYASRRI